LEKSKEIHQLDLRIISGKADCVRHRVKAKISKFNFFVDELVAVDISSSESIS